MEGGRALASGPLADMPSRLNLPIRLGEDAGVVIDATVDAVDDEWHLTRAGFAGGAQASWTRSAGRT